MAIDYKSQWKDFSLFLINLCHYQEFPEVQLENKLGSQRVMIGNAARIVIRPKSANRNGRIPGMIAAINSSTINCSARTAYITRVPEISKEQLEDIVQNMVRKMHPGRDEFEEWDLSKITTMTIASTSVSIVNTFCMSHPHRLSTRDNKY